MLPPWLFVGMEVFAAHPLKQGLKQIEKERAKERQRVFAAHPLKQGLKLDYRYNYTAHYF